MKDKYALIIAITMVTFLLGAVAVQGTLIYNLSPEVDTYSSSGHWNSNVSRPFTGRLESQELHVRFHAWNIASDHHTYMRFNLGDIDNWDVTEPNRSATLNLYVIDTPRDVATLRVRRIDPNNTNTDVANMDYLGNFVEYDDEGDPISETMVAWTGGYRWRESAGTGSVVQPDFDLVGYTGWVELDVTEMVDAWLGDGDLNNGFIFSPRGAYGGNPDGTNTEVRLASSSYETVAWRPTLAVVIPEPSTLALLGLAGLLLMKRRQI